MAADELLTVEEIADRVKVTQETVRRWLRGGRLPGLRLSDKAGWRVKASDLERFLASMSADAPSLGPEPREPTRGKLTGYERGREG